jgi:hypothetical protein
MGTNQTTWHTLSPQAPYVLLSAVDPPDARRPGPVVGPGTRVRPCDPCAEVRPFAVVCIEVDTAKGPPTHGYTDFPLFPAPGRRRWSVRLAAVVGVAAAVATAAVSLS